MYQRTACCDVRSIYRIGSQTGKRRWGALDRFESTHRKWRGLPTRLIAFFDHRRSGVWIKSVHFCANSCEVRRCLASAVGDGAPFTDLGEPWSERIHHSNTRARRAAAGPVHVPKRRQGQALDLGADDYVTKPFGMDELLARMRAALRHQLQTHGERPIFRLGDLSVDLVRRIVKVRDKLVKLSPKEYDLLRVLVQHAGKVLTHKYLLTELWGDLSDAQYLRVYVRQLRQKLEDDPEKPKYIHTETGIGYRLCAPD